MAIANMSLKKLKELHKSLGGSRNGYYITVYGNDINTGKSIRISQRIAKNVRRSASADYYLVKGTRYSRK